jgi:hypothetical protein
MNAWKSLLALFVLTVHCARNSDEFVTVDMSSQANFAWGAAINDPNSTTVLRLPGAPVGNVTLGGVQFNIKSNASGLQALDSNIAAGGGSAVETLTIPVSTAAVSEVYALINIEWGQNGPASYAKITVNPTGGLSAARSRFGGARPGIPFGASMVSIIATNPSCRDSPSSSFTTRVRTLQRSSPEASGRSSRRR